MKSPLRMNIAERKSDLIRRCFIYLADGDYLTARWAYHNGLTHAFYWNAAQALEKYLKAFVLYNGGSAKLQGHGLERLMEQARAIGGDDTIPKLITMPGTTSMGREAWEGEQIGLFVEYLSTYGSTDNRYGTIGSFHNGPVIHILDSICEAIRHKIRFLNFLSGDLLTFYNDQASIDDKVSGRDWMIGGDLVLERLYAGRYDVGMKKNLRDQFSVMNFAFFAADQAIGETFGGIIIRGSPVLNHLVRLATLNRSQSNIDIVRRLRDWVFSNIKLPLELRKYIENEIL